LVVCHQQGFAPFGCGSFFPIATDCRCFVEPDVSKRRAFNPPASRSVDVELSARRTAEEQERCLTAQQGRIALLACQIYGNFTPHPGICVHEPRAWLERYGMSFHFVALRSPLLRASYSQPSDNSRAVA